MNQLNTDNTEGSGNLELHIEKLLNGGDGLAAARHLHAGGHEVAVMLFGDPSLRVGGLQPRWSQHAGHLDVPLMHEAVGA